MSTETELREWRWGQTQAERLCAALLDLEGFGGVDPQHPLGGRDGLKNVLCERGGHRWVAAAYFPTTHPTFPEVRKKFADDFAGVAKNKASGFAFFVNQYLTIGERDELLGASAPVETEIYHLERIRALLDAPKGYGIRLQYLRIAMTLEEQISFFSALNYDLMRRLIDNDARLARIDAKLDLVLIRTGAQGIDVQSGPSSLNTVNEDVEAIETPTANLSLGTLCWIHRMVTENTSTPESVRGRFRAVQVWIGPPGVGMEDAIHVAPPPSEILPRTKDLIGWWRARHREVRGADRPTVVKALAELHHGFLLIHPFVDANGRVGRVLLDEAARELAGNSVGPELASEPNRYFAALRAADGGDYVALERLITASLR